MWTVQTKKICKHYKSSEFNNVIFNNLSLKIETGKFTVFSGRSGSGKTTLLNLVSGIDKPESGEILIDGQDIFSLCDNELSEFRAKTLGFIFQNFSLIPVLTAYENIEIPLMLQNTKKADRKRKIMDMLDRVGLADKARALPNQLSGGQQQRVAIARALIHSPSLIIADEPTANLDNATGKSILQLLRTLQVDNKFTIIFSSHDPLVINSADNLYLINDGTVKLDGCNLRQVG